MSKSRFWVLLYKWHAWSGLISGVFMLLICVSGAVAIFNPELERAVEWSASDYQIVHDGRPPITLEQAIATAQQAYPGSIVKVAHYPDYGGSTQSHGEAYLVKLGLGKGKGSLDVMVHPYEQRVLATMAPNGGWGRWVRDLHVRLLYGSYWGRWIVGVFGLVLMFLTISGLMLYPRFNGGWWPRVRWNQRWRITWSDLHKLVGIGTLAFNVMFGLTGAVLGLEGAYRKYVMAPLPPAMRLEGVANLPPGFIDRAAERARDLIPGGTVRSVTLGHARTGVLRVHVEVPPHALIKEGASYVSFSVASGEPVEVYDARNASLAGRFYFSMEPLHFGRLGGSMLIKIIWAVMGVSGGLLAISGYLIYFLRKWPTWTRPRREAPAMSVNHAG